MKKILIFSLSYYPHNVSGAEAAIKEITDRTQNIEFHMITLRYNSYLPKTEKIGNVLIHRIGLTAKNPTFEDLGKLPLDLNKPLYQFLAPLKAWRLHKKYNYDGLWAMMAHSTGVPAAIFNIFYPQVKYALTLQEGDPIAKIEKTMRPLWPLFTKAFSRATIVQTISSYLADWAKKHGVKPEKIELIYNGANPEDFKNNTPTEELNRLKIKLNKQTNDIYLVNTARLVTQKGHDSVIRALAKLEPNIKFLLVGAGPEEANLKKLSQELGLTSRVIFIGAIDRTEVTKYRKISDIFVGPSRSEGLGNAFLSAMASHLPVIATRSGGLSEFIFDQKTAWVVDKDSPEQIVEAVRNILKHPDKVKTTTDSAYQMVYEKYNWDQISQKMQEKIFKKILA